MLEIGDKVIFPRDFVGAPVNTMFTVQDIDNGLALLTAPVYGEPTDFGKGGIMVKHRDAEEYSFKSYCQDCVDPVTNELHEEVCLARRNTGVCPQLPVIDRMKIQMAWLADKWLMDADPYELCHIHEGEGLTKEQIIQVAEREANR